MEPQEMGWEAGFALGISISGLSCCCTRGRIGFYLDEQLLYVVVWQQRQWKAGEITSGHPQLSMLEKPGKTMKPSLIQLASKEDQSARWFSLVPPGFADSIQTSIGWNINPFNHPATFGNRTPWPGAPSCTTAWGLLEKRNRTGRSSRPKPWWRWRESNIPKLFMLIPTLWQCNHFTYSYGTWPIYRCFFDDLPIQHGDVL